jgi:hypothetical protein
MDDRRQGGKLKKGDLILLLCILALSGVIWLAVHFLRGKGATVVITDADHTRITLPLEEDTEQRFYSGDGWNVVEIRDGRVRVTSADCPEQICVHHSPIDTTGETIICLPHKLTVEVQ